MPLNVNQLPLNRTLTREVRSSSLLVPTILLLALAVITYLVSTQPPPVIQLTAPLASGLPRNGSRVNSSSGFLPCSLTRSEQKTRMLGSFPGVLTEIGLKS